jgi:hypothetical protein
MKISQLSIIIAQLTVTAPIAFSDQSDSCYFTGIEVCKDKGTVLSSIPVKCRSATLYNQIITETPAYRYIAISGYDNDSRQGKVAMSFQSSVLCTTTTIDPATCNISIGLRAKLVRITCKGEAANPNAAKCQFALREPSSNTDDALALLTQ